MALKRNPRKSVGDEVDPLLVQCTQGVPVKSVARRGPEPRIQAVSAQDSEPGPDPFPLRWQIHAGKLRVTVNPQKTFAATRSRVPVAMNRDRGASCLHR